MAPRRPAGWTPLVLAVGVTAAGAAVMGWRVYVSSVQARIRDRQAALKKLVLSGKIPPNQQVMDYLTARDAALQTRYQHWLKAVTATPLAEAASADPQLYFQEQFHDVQRTLERLASARGLAVPEQLGFPKELPPSDTVPRLLVQLSLMKELAEAIFAQGVGELVSLKIEDPDSMADQDDASPFLIRLPVRVRLVATLPQFMKVLAAVDRMSPLVDVRAMRVATAQTPEHLDVELLVSRCLVAPASTVEAPTPPEKTAASSPKKGSSPAGPRGRSE